MIRQSNFIIIETIITNICVLTNLENNDVSILRFFKLMFTV